MPFVQAVEARVKFLPLLRIEVEVVVRGPLGESIEMAVANSQQAATAKCRQA
jgi:hypothetical protein